MSEAIQHAVNALSLGGTYALLALGLAIVFSIMRLINLAHGELLTIGGYTIWYLTDHGVSWAVAAPTAVAVATLVAVVMERVAFRPLRGASVMALLLTSFAVGFFIQNFFGIVVSPRPQGITVPESFNEAITIGDVTIPLLQILTIATVAVCLGVLVILLGRTMTGIAMRAAAQDFTTVRLMGIRANRVVVMAFALSGFMAGVASILYFARSGSVQPTTGFGPVVKAFIVIVVGGLGSLVGAVAGGFLLGSLEVSLHVVLPADALSFADALVLTIVIAILLARPHGIFGRPADVAT